MDTRTAQAHRDFSRKRGAIAELLTQRRKDAKISLCAFAPLRLCVNQISSKGDFQSKLNLPRRRGRSNRPERPRGAIAVCPAKVRLIQQIERLHPELYLRYLIDRQFEILLQTQVELIKRVTARDVAAGVAKRLIHARNDYIVPVE